MSYIDADDALNAFANKTAGDLIRADDWNNLVSGISSLSGELHSLIQNLQQTVGDPLDATDAPSLHGRVRALEEQNNAQDIELREEFKVFKTQVEPLLNQYQMTLQTSKTSYLLGGTAEITAQVLDLNGEVPNPLPWVDFVVTWGKVSPVSGFVTREGMGGDSISVRVNSEGIARVKISAFYNKWLSQTQELQVQQFFQTNMSGGVLEDIVLGAGTSQDAGLEASYNLMTDQYQASGDHGFKVLANGYYADTLVDGGKQWGILTGQWKDHRTTVLAFAKADGNPATPDQSRASASMQLNFRDWIGPWVINYFDIPPIVIEEFRPRFEPRINPDDYYVSLDAIQELLEDEMSGQGLLGRHRGLKVADLALDDLNVGDPPSFMGQLKRTTKDAILSQQIMDVLQVGIPAFSNNGSENVMMHALIAQNKDTAATVNNVLAVQKQVSQVDSNMTNMLSQVTAVESGISGLTTRMNKTETTSLNIHTSLTDISSRIDGISDLDATGVINRLQEINANIGTIQLGIQNLPIRR